MNLVSCLRYWIIADELIHQRWVLLDKHVKNFIKKLDFFSLEILRCELNTLWGLRNILMMYLFHLRLSSKTMRLHRCAFKRALRESSCYGSLLINNTVLVRWNNLDWWLQLLFLFSIFFYELIEWLHCIRR